MHYAQAYPHALEKLVVVDIGPKAYPVRHQRILEGMGAMDPGTLESRQQADLLLAPYVEQVGIRQFLLKNLTRDDSGQFTWKLNLPVIRENIEQVGLALPPQPQIEISTLFIRGQHSDYILDQDFTAIRDQFPKAQLETIAGTGHWLHSEDPQGFLQVVNEFLDHR